MSEITIEQAKRFFSEWRKNRKGGHVRVPDKLRQIAVTLARKYGDSRISEELKLSSSSLWEWRRQLPRTTVSSRDDRSGKNTMSVKKVRAKINTDKTGDFVEVKPIAIANVDLCVEWYRPDGISMKISGITALQADQLANNFLSKR